MRSSSPRTAASIPASSRCSSPTTTAPRPGSSSRSSPIARALFVVLDADTARLHPEAAAPRRGRPSAPPSSTRLAHYNAEMARDIDRGDEPELFFIYAGHGDVDATGQGYINLRDAKLTRAELYRDVIAPSKARFVHVIVDACKSYFLVNSRGGKKRWVDDRVPRRRGRAATRSCRRSSRRSRSSTIRAPASSSPPRAIRRRTSGRAIAAASSRTSCARRSPAPPTSTATGASSTRSCARFSPRPTRACATPRRASTSSRARPRSIATARSSICATARRQRALPALRAGLGGRFLIEDDRGVRIADLNKEVGAAFDVMVSARHAYYVRSDDTERPRCAPASAASRSSTLTWHARAIASRGALDASLPPRSLPRAYGRGFYDGFVATSAISPSKTTPRRSSQPAPGARAPAPSALVAYALSGAPAGDSGLSNGVDVRYAYRFWRALDLGIAGQAAQAPARPAVADARRGACSCSAPSGVRSSGSGCASTAPSAAAALGQPAARRRNGSPAPSRAASATSSPAAERQRRRQLRPLRARRLALDGVYPQVSPSSLRPNGFLNLGVQFSL